MIWSGPAEQDTVSVPAVAEVVTQSFALMCVFARAQYVLLGGFRLRSGFGVSLRY